MGCVSATENLKFSSRSASTSVRVTRKLVLIVGLREF